jgi:hypothetical protein
MQQHSEREVAMREKHWMTGKMDVAVGVVFWSRCLAILAIIGLAGICSLSAAEGYNPLNILPKTPPKGKWRFGATADLHTPANPIAEYVRKQQVFHATLQERNIQVMLNLGDVVSWTDEDKTRSDKKEWAKFEELWKDSRSKIAHFITPGNHCIHNDKTGESDFDEYLRVSGVPGQTREKMDFTFDFANVRFVSLNCSGFVFSENKYGWSDPMSAARIKEIQDYLDKLLDSAVGKVDHVVIFQHIGAYAPQSRYSADSISKLKSLYDRLAAQHSKKALTVTWLRGHDHMYYRTFRHSMNFIGVPSGGANGTWKYGHFNQALQSDKAQLNLIDGDVWKEGEQCFIEGEVDGKVIEFRLVAFNNHDNCSYKKGAILDTVRVVCLPGADEKGGTPRKGVSK